jgi:hypothetical protein
MGTEKVEHHNHDGHTVTTNVLQVATSEDKTGAVSNEILMLCLLDPNCGNKLARVMG